MFSPPTPTRLILGLTEIGPNGRVYGTSILYALPHPLLLLWHTAYLMILHRFLILNPWDANFFKAVGGGQNADHGVSLGSMAKLEVTELPIELK